MTDVSRMRIGDADRDHAVETLSEHYASGRLTKDEYDERVDQVWAARYYTDLDPLFADLPRSDQPRVAARNPTPRHPTGRACSTDRRSNYRSVPRLFLALPLLAVGAIAAAVILGAPWLLFVLFWVFACGGFGRRNAPGAHRW